MKYMAIDFETVYTEDVSVRIMPTVNYCLHPVAVPYLVAVYNEEFQYTGEPEQFNWDVLKDHTLIMHNAHFDGVVLKRLHREGKIPAWVLDLPIVDTADMSSYLRHPRALGDLVSVLFPDVKLEKAIRTKAKGKTARDVQGEGWWQDMVKYGGEDAEYTYKVWQQLSDRWPLHERKLSKMNRDSCWKGIHIDINLAHQYLEQLNSELSKLERSIPWDWSDHKTPASPKMIRQQCREDGIECPASFAEKSPECAMWEEKHAEKYPWVRCLRDWKKRNFLRSRIKQLVDGVDENNIYHYDLKYCGADSGRYSAGFGDGGSNRFSVHNMPRIPSFGIDIRKLLIAREGHSLMIWDLAQIEPRLVHWLTGNTELLTRIRETGVSVYQAEAETCYNRTWKNLKKEDPELYSFIKAQYLGCQYQCSGGKFQLLAKTMAGMDLTEAQAKKIVDDFRSNNPKVPCLWYKLQEQVKVAASKNENLTIVLPSDRSLVYFNVRKGPFGFEAQFTRGSKLYYKIYGGHLTNNLIQGAGRDVFCENMLRLSDTEFGTPLWHAHDEGINEVPDEIANDPKKQKELERLVTTSPAWGEDLPLGTEIVVSKHYLK